MKIAIRPIGESATSSQLAAETSFVPAAKKKSQPIKKNLPDFKGQGGQ